MVSWAKSFSSSPWFLLLRLSLLLELMDESDTTLLDIRLGLFRGCFIAVVDWTKGESDMVRVLM